MTENEIVQAIEELRKEISQKNKIDIADRILWCIIGGLVVWFLSHLNLL